MHPARKQQTRREKSNKRDFVSFSSKSNFIIFRHHVKPSFCINLLIYPFINKKLIFSFVYSVLIKRERRFKDSSFCCEFGSVASTTNTTSEILSRVITSRHIILNQTKVFLLVLFCSDEIDKTICELELSTQNEVLNLVNAISMRFKG